ncbi:MAG: endonuclease III [Terriglobales bacterium]
MPRGIMPRRPAKTGRHEAGRLTAGVVVARMKPGKGRKLGATAFTGSGSTKVPKKMASRATKNGASKGYNPTSPERVSEILKRLDHLYPDVTCALTHKDPWELLVATILSAQSTDVRVNMVTPELFKKYPTVQDFAKLEPKQLEADIRSTGFFRNKSKSVVGAARKVVNEYGGNVPQTMEDLLTLPGVARKTANVVLGTWFKIADGLVVDTHVHRISRRLEMTRNDDPKKIEQDLMGVIPREKWILFSHQVIWHGRKLCFARSPKCVDCSLENVCHAEDKTWSTVEKHKGARA